MKLIDRFDPKLPKDVTTRQLHSTFIDTRKIPLITMSLKEDAVFAEVVFDYYYDNKNSFPNFQIVKRIISGPSDEVYSVAAKVASRISLTLSKKFNDEWQRSLMQLLNKPSKNKTILNLGLYKNNSYGIYDIEEPKTLLARLMSENDIKQKDLAFNAGVDKTTLWRHLNGKLEISREDAIKYAKVLGCDPAKILFNDLQIPMWGSVDTLSMATVNRLSVYASEIIVKDNLGTIECPREIYRPDVKAIKIESGSSLDGQVAFYYNSNEPIELEDQIVIVGTKLKNFSNDIIRERYFIGTYKKNRDGKTIDLYTIDPQAVDISGIEPDEDMHSFDHVVSFTEDQMKVIEGIIPTFVAPVVAMIDPSKIYSPVKTDIQKAYNEIYTASRSQEARASKIFKNIQMRTLVEEKANKELLVNEDDDMLDELHKRKIKALLDADKRLQSVISTNAYAKKEKKFDIKDKVKEIKSELTDKENEITQQIFDNLADGFEEPSPSEEDYVHIANND